MFKAGDVVVFNEKRIVKIVEELEREQITSSFFAWAADFCLDRDICEEECKKFGKYSDSSGGWVCEKQIRKATEQEQFMFILFGEREEALEKIK